MIWSGLLWQSWWKFCFSAMINKVIKSILGKLPPETCFRQKPWKFWLPLFICIQIFHRDLQGPHYHFWMEWIWYHFEDLKVHFFPVLVLLKSVSKSKYFGSFHCSSNKWQSSSNSWWQSKGDWLMLNRWTKRMERNCFYKPSVRWCKKARISWVKVAEDWSQKTCQPPVLKCELIAILWLVGYCCYSFLRCTVFWFFWISDRFWGWRRWVPWRERCPKERFWWCSCSTWCKMDCP